MKRLVIRVPSDPANPPRLVFKAEGQADRESALHGAREIVLFLPDNVEFVIAHLASHPSPLDAIETTIAL